MKRSPTDSATPARMPRPIDARTESTTASSAGSATTRTDSVPLAHPAALAAVTVTAASPSDAGLTVSWLPASTTGATSGADDTAEKLNPSPTK